MERQVSPEGLVWYLATFDLGPDIAHGYTRGSAAPMPPDPRAAPTASWIATHDGSWTEVTLAAEHGRHAVIEGGPRRLWQLVEHAHDLWVDLGRPGWVRLGRTVDPDRQTVWIDDPGSAHRWPLTYA